MLRIKNITEFYLAERDEMDGGTEPEDFFSYKLRYPAESFEDGKFKFSKKKLDDTQIFTDVKAIWAKHKEAVLEYRAYRNAVFKSNIF